MTETGDRQKEEEHIVGALTKCGYPRWSFEKVKTQIEKKKERRKGQEKEKEYGLSRLQRISHLTLRKMGNRGYFTYPQ